MATMHMWSFLCLFGAAVTGLYDDSDHVDVHTEIEEDERSTVGKYEIVYSYGSEHGLVQVVRMDVNDHTVDYLLCGRSVLGARIIADDLKEHDLFTVFRLLKSLRFLQPQPTNALLLGLGAGIVASNFRRHGIRTDVMEINDGIIEAAHLYFDYNRSEESTIVGDVRRLIYESRPAGAQRYDLIIHDLHVGGDAAIVLTQELFALIRNSWLHSNGVLVVNFVGFSSSPLSRLFKEAFALSLAVVATLRSVFRHVRCYRELPLTFNPSAPSNILCFCAENPWKLKPPSHGHASKMSPEWLSAHFLKWEVLRDATGSDIITEATTVRYKRAGNIIGVEMHRLAQRDFMPHRQFWEKLAAQLGPAWNDEL